MLKKIIIIARHGPREPLVLLPKLKTFKSNDPYDAHLTLNGKECCKKFGQCIRSVYGDKINVSKENMLVLSSNVERTVQSAKYFMKGFVNDDSFETKYNHHDALYGHIKLSDSHTAYIRNIKCSDDMSNLNKKISDVTGFNVDKSNDYFGVYSTIECYLHENIDLPFELDNMMIDEIKCCATTYFNKLFSNSELLGIFADPIFKLINELLKNDSVRFAYLSTHDVIVFPLALYIITSYHQNKIGSIKIPSFCSFIKYEVYEGCTKIYYDDELIVCYIS